MNILWLGSRHGLNSFEQVAVIFVLAAAFISLAYAWWLRGIVLKKDKGTEKMQEVWNAIRIGANSYLGQQLRTILPLIGILTLVMFFSVYVVPPSLEAQEEFKVFGDQGIKLIIAFGRTIAFIMGASFSLMVGQWGMRIS
jgi:K(+)-stimulated pyrophosphate-energized sodium pump